MKITKDTQATARRLFRLCCPDGVLDEPKLLEIVDTVLAEKPRNYRALARALTMLAGYAVKRRTVIITSAVPLTDGEREALTKKIEARHGAGLYYQWVCDPSTIAGIRVQVGDEVRDATVRARLDKLAQAVESVA